jgi:hypothetical protein
MSDFEQQLSKVKFWDSEVEAVFQELGVPAFDAALQIREEVIVLCEWINENDINSYLEVGSWTGKLVSSLHTVFKFKEVAACDLGACKEAGFEVRLPPGAEYFEGNSLSPIYLKWRDRLGPIDLVLIDTDHKYESVARNFEINQALGAKHIALCGISDNHRGISGVRSFWHDLEGNKTEILCPHVEIGESESTIGIGIWSEE